jgi:hypothetical protein
MGKFEQAGNLVSKLNVERPYSEPGLLLGTSSFTAHGWQGSFYRQGMQMRNFLSYYATRFKTVEIDSTYYGTPSASTVNNWCEGTPALWSIPRKEIGEASVLAMPVSGHVTESLQLGCCKSDLRASKLAAP